MDLVDLASPGERMRCGPQRFRLKHIISENLSGDNHRLTQRDAAAVIAAMSMFDAELIRLDIYLIRAIAGLGLDAARPDASDYQPAAGLSFLIVDDHAFQRNTLHMLLAQFGATSIAEAADGQAALALLSEPRAHVDIVVSDLDMPNMDGMELIRHLSGRNNPPSLILSSALEPAVLSSVATMSEEYGSCLLACCRSRSRASCSRRRSPSTGPRHLPRRAACRTRCRCTQSSASLQA